MNWFRRYGQLLAAVTVSTYLPLALIPAPAWAQVGEGDHDDVPHSDPGNSPADVRADVPADAAASSTDASAGAELPGLSDVDRVLASLPTGGAPVSGNAVALPSGAATALGMGESFSAQLSTGTAAMSLPFSLLSARGRVQPSLALSYNSGGGFGLAGVGWSVGTAAISRQTDRGIPSYDDRADFHPEQDRFLLGGIELVPICTVRAGVCDRGLPGERMPVWANDWQYFRPRLEGTFIRVFWSPDHRTWRVQGKDGTNMELGVPLDGTRYTGALERNPEQPDEIFRWYLVREYDSQGGANDAAGPAPVNVIVFRYFEDEGVAYLSDIYDTSPAADPTTTDLTRFAHHTRLRYEPRPDRTTSYRAGFHLAYGLRLAGVDVTSKPFDGPNVTTAPRQLVRRYHLAYEPDQHRSLLETVQPEGRCSAAVPEDALGELPRAGCPRLPAVRFEYQHVASRAEPVLDSAGYAFEPFATTVEELDNSPPHSLDEPDVGLIDANLDGLSDVLVTAPGRYNGQHALFFNGEDGEAGFGAAVPVGVERLSGVTAGVLRLSNINVSPLDLDADGSLDLVHMPYVKRYEVFSLERGPAPRWRGRVANTAAGESPKINFARDARDTRVMDVNADGLVDIVYTSPTEVQTFFSLGRFPDGDGKFGQGTWTGPDTAELTTEPVRSCAPWSAKSARFSDPDVFVADMNGDGLADLARVRNRQILYWPGRGNGMFGTGDRHTCRGGGFGADRHIAMINAPNLGVVAPGRMLLADVNGDGFSDVLELRSQAVDVYLNDNGEGFSQRFILDQTPFLPNSASYVQLSDIDGSGTPDIVWGKAHDYRYVDLTGGVTPHLLVRTHNGVGRTMTFSYRATTDLMRDAARAGKPWESTAPTVAPVLVQTEVTDNLQRVGRVPTRVVTEYSYRDPVFAGREREFRGFREATTRALGDATHPTSLTRSLFLLGECQDDNDTDDVDVCSPAERWREHGREGLKGLPVLSEAYDEQGVYHATHHTTYELRKLYEGRDGRRVSVVYPVEKDAYLYDTADFDAAPQPVSLTDVRLSLDEPPSTQVSTVQLRARRGRVRSHSQTSFDNFGNVVEAREDGCVEGCPAGVDETLIAHSDYTLPPGDGSGWLWREDSAFATGSIQTERRSEVRHLYNAQGNLLRTFAALRGTLPLQRWHAQGKTVAPQPATQSGGLSSPTEVLLKDNSYDGFGHISW